MSGQYGYIIRNTITFPRPSEMHCFLDMEFVLFSNDTNLFTYYLA